MPQWHWLPNGQKFMYVTFAQLAYIISMNQPRQADGQIFVKLKYKKIKVLPSRLFVRIVIILIMEYFFGISFFICYCFIVYCGQWL